MFWHKSRKPGHRITGRLLSADLRHPIGFTESAAGIERPRHVDTGNRFERQIIAMMLQFSDILADIDKLKVLNYFRK